MVYAGATGGQFHLEPPPWPEPLCVCGHGRWEHYAVWGRCDHQAGCPIRCKFYERGKGWDMSGLGMPEAPLAVKITEEMRARARYAQEEVNRNASHGNPYTGLQVPHAHYLGSLGEQVLYACLAAEGKRVAYAPRYDGMPDDGDVFVWSGGKRIVLDAKAADEKRNYCGIPLPQWEKYNKPGVSVPTFVGVWITHDSWGEVYGFEYLPHFRFVAAKDRPGVTVDTMLVDIGDLLPMSRMLAKLDAGDAIAQFPSEER